MDTKTTIKERIIAFLDYKGIGQGRFEKLCGLSNGYVTNIGTSISVDKLLKICCVFPEINRDWLLTGEGEMLKQAGNVAVGSAVVAQGNNSTNSNTINAGSDTIAEKLLAELSAQRELTAKAQQQIDRLLALLEGKDGNQ